MDRIGAPKEDLACVGTYRKAPTRAMSKPLKRRETKMSYILKTTREDTVNRRGILGQEQQYNIEIDPSKFGNSLEIVTLFLNTSINSFCILSTFVVAYYTLFLLIFTLSCDEIYLFLS